MTPKRIVIGVSTGIVLFAALGWYVVTHRATENIAYTTQLVTDTTSSTLPSVIAYNEATAAALSASPSLLQVAAPTTEQSHAYDLVVRDDRMQTLLKDDQQQPYRVEVLQSYPLPTGQAVDALAECARTTCYRLDMYNFTQNQAIVAVIDLTNERVVQIQPSSTQPDLSARLEQVARDIASNNPVVKQELAGRNAKPIMSTTMKTSLKRTVCERSHHLCVAPTYVLTKEKQALWTIVDLTDMKLVGTAWTKWDDQLVAPITERQLQTTAVETSLCGKVTEVTRGPWRFNYTLTGSDGLELRDVQYKNKPVITSAKNVDWHVSYSQRDGFGYSDAVGCPVFSTAAVVPSQLPKVTSTNDQVVLSVDFIGEQWPQPCNYYYQQQFQMNADGSLRVAVANLGRGCGDDATYRPVTRIELPAGSRNFNHAGQAIGRESWWQPDNCESGTGCTTLQYDSSGTRYNVIPGNGQFNDGGRGDNPYVYVTSVTDAREEGQHDLLTIGPCCNVDYHQGPDKFVNNELLGTAADSRVALWYVAQQKNSGTPGEEYCWASSNLADGRYQKTTYPCVSGPLITPVSSP